VSVDEQFSWSKRDGVAVVCPPGELDLHNADRLRGFCRDTIDAAGPRVVVDLTATTFLDSTALGVFVGIHKHVKARDGWLRLVTGDSRAVQKILEITALDAILGSYPTVDDAITAALGPHQDPQPA
jgi:anti-sigma B factor antagonist